MTITDNRVRTWLSDHRTTLLGLGQLKPATKNFRQTSVYVHKSLAPESLSCLGNKALKQLPLKAVNFHKDACLPSSAGDERSIVVSRLIWLFSLKHTQRSCLFKETHIKIKSLWILGSVWDTVKQIFLKAPLFSLLTNSTARWLGV